MSLVKAEWPDVHMASIQAMIQLSMHAIPIKHIIFHAEAALRNAAVESQWQPHGTTVPCSTCHAEASDLWLLVVAHDAHSEEVSTGSCSQLHLILRTMAPWAHALH